MNRILRALLITLLVSSSAHAQASVGVGASLFEKGRTRATITGGWGQAFNQDYFLLGGGLGYYLFRGFEVGVDGEAWIGDDPQFQKVTPQLRYVFSALGSLYPYVGVFYRRTFYSDLPDLDSTGARLGLYAPMGRNVYVGGGAVIERYLDCNQDVYDSCTSVYPEFSINFLF